MPLPVGLLYRRSTSSCHPLFLWYEFANMPYHRSGNSGDMPLIIQLSLLIVEAVMGDDYGFPIGLDYKARRFRPYGFEAVFVVFIIIPCVECSIIQLDADYILFHKLTLLSLPLCSLLCRAHFPRVPFRGGVTPST